MTYFEDWVQTQETPESAIARLTKERDDLRAALERVIHAWRSNHVPDPMAIDALIAPIEMTKFKRPDGVTER